MNANLYALFERHFPEDLEQPFLIIPNGRVISYGELAAESSRIAHALVAVGCRPGDRVAVQTDKDWRVLALYLACLRAGFVYLPLNSGYQRSELNYFFADSQPRVIVCRGDALGVVATIAQRATVLTLDANGGELGDRAREMPDSFATVHLQPDDLAAVLYTSGTTGRAKGAMLSHRNLASNAIALVAAWGFTRGDVLLHALPAYHVHGLFVTTHCVLLSGSRMLWLARFDAGEVASLLPRATVLMGVPTFYSRLLAEPALTRESCRGVRLFVSGSAPLLPDTFEAFRARTGHAILERYGMTETGMNTSNPLDGARVAGTVGPPLPGVAVRIADANGEDSAGSGVVGDVQVKGPNVFSGYWQMPEKTRDEFTADGYFKTGDLGEWVPDGPGCGYLRLVGRVKDLIITGGLNVYPLEIEEHINLMDGVVESAVIGVPDADFGESVTAVVVGRPNHTLTAASIIAALKTDMAAFKVPKRVLFVPELPRNAMGKVQKNVLRERHSVSGPAGSEA
ncbi:MAG: malonyl-CoA synthase [Betaproteobacteria bacterium]|nr:malonyl-CoA synthase [Betaproteobacteria bacterium]MBA3777500.1 malonyl-CoA synthase [Betaproteobacteria bacterium]